MIAEKSFKKYKQNANVKILNALETNAPFAFVSSIFFELKNFRKEINELNNLNDDYLPVYVDEEIYNKVNDIDTLKHIVSDMDKSEVVVVIFAMTENDFNEREIRSRLDDKLSEIGSLISLNYDSSFKDCTSVSFWEIELFKIAISKKKTFFLAAKDNKYAQSLIEFFQMVPWLKPRIKAQLTFAEIILEVKSILKSQKLLSKSNIISINPYLKSIEKWKTNPVYEDMWVKQIHIGKKNKNNYNRDPSVETIQSSISFASDNNNHSLRLSYLWLCYRELYRLPWTDEEFKSFLPAWNRFYSLWSDAAAWYGLHGYFDMAMLNTVNKMKTIREQLKDFEIDEVEKEYPANIIANAYYSLAKYSSSPQKYLDKAMNEIEIGFANNCSSIDSLFSTRGSIYIQEKKLKEAVDDLRKVLEIREANGSSNLNIQEAKAKLGFAIAIYDYSRLKFNTVGIKMMEEAIAKMETSNFKLTSLNKLKLLYQINLKIWNSKYHIISKEIKQSAVELGAYDQTRRRKLR